MLCLIIFLLLYIEVYIKMSYQYTTFQNKIPIIEKYVNDRYVSTINVSNYNNNNKNYNYFILEPSNDNSSTSYILRVKSPIRNHQIFTCAAGGHGGLMYGKGGSGGNYLYIDNTNVNTSSSDELSIGSYLIVPGRAIDVLSILENSTYYKNLMSSITINGGMYLIRYNNDNFNEYKTSLQNLDDYKKRDWFTNADNTIGEITSIDAIYNNRNNKVNIFNNVIRTIELIFYLKKGKTFRFTNFTNPNYTRLIRISNNYNINVRYEPTSADNYTYQAGNYDEIISIICYPNSSSISFEKQINWNDLIDLEYNTLINNKNNFYIYNFNKRNEINQIDDIIYNISNENIQKNTYIFYNVNPDASLSDLKNKIDKYYLGLQGGVDGDITNITYNEFINESSILRRFYMPYLFATQKIANLFGGSSGSTYVSNFNNIILRKLGGGNFIKLNEIYPTNIRINPITKEWSSGFKGYYRTNFKINAYFPKNQNIELNNTTLSNGGFTGYWQFIKDEVNYNFGANGINDLDSPNYGTYGCGGQGGSVLIDKNSKFTGSKGRNGVFILTFLNYALASIVNDNSNIIKKMFELFIKNNKKLSYINELTDNNIIINNFNSIPNLISKLLNNTFIHEGSVHLDELLLNKFQTFIDKSNLIKLLATTYIIQRIYYILSENIKDINFKNINIFEIYFINELNNEKIETSDKSNILKIYIYDKINDNNIDNIIGYKYTKKFFSTLSKNNYHLYIDELENTNKIIIYKENNKIFDLTNNNKNIIDNNYNNNDNYYKFIINNISYIYDLEYKDLKININVIETIFQIFRLNAIIYSIVYYNTDNSLNYSKAIINNIYDNLKNYNYDIKTITDKITSKDNIFIEQNEFKLYFNNRINEYNQLQDRNIQHQNLIKSKKAYSETKENLKNNINFISFIIYFILVFIVLWLLYIILRNYNEYDVIPHFLLIFIILIILIFTINYYNYYYTYKEFFNTNENDNINNLTNMDIFNDTNDYKETEVLYNNEKYKIIFVNSTSDFILYKNSFTSFVIITRGEDGYNEESRLYDGTGGTINIYDADYIANNINENNKYTININNKGANISINELIKNNYRSELDIKDNIKIFYNNFRDTNNNNNYKTLKEYYDNIKEDNSIKEILGVLFNNSKNAYFYGSKGNTIYDNNIIINKINYPESYGLGGIYDNIDKTGNNGVFIIISKITEFSSIHNDIQTLVNMYNNNINKLIYDKFNKIYLIDNNIIYDNAMNSFRKKYTKEEEKSNNYKLIETNLNQYSNNILMDVYFKYELAKLFTYIVFILVLCILIYIFNRSYYLIIIFIFTIFVIFILLNFYFNIKRNTRRDYYKYYWSKYNNK
jgi:hypothetical protein